MFVHTAPTVTHRTANGILPLGFFNRSRETPDKVRSPGRPGIQRGSKKLENTLKHLHARQAEESLRTTKMLDLMHDAAPVKDPRLFTMQVRRDQSAAFETERNRYILDHRAAQRLAEEVNKQERENTLSQEFNLKFHR